MLILLGFTVEHTLQMSEKVTNAKGYIHKASGQTRIHHHQSQRSCTHKHQLVLTNLYSINYIQQCNKMHSNNMETYISRWLSLKLLVYWIQENFLIKNSLLNCLKMAILSVLNECNLHTRTSKSTSLIIIIDIIYIQYNMRFFNTLVL